MNNQQEAKTFNVFKNAINEGIKQGFVALMNPIHNLEIENINRKKMTSTEDDDKQIAPVKHEPLDMMDIEKLQNELTDISKKIEDKKIETVKKIEELEKAQKFEIGKGSSLYDDNLYPKGYYGKSLQYQKKLEDLKWELKSEKIEVPQIEKANLYDSKIKIETKLEKAKMLDGKIEKLRTSVYESFNELQQMYDEHVIMVRIEEDRQKELEREWAEWDKQLDKDDFDFEDLDLVE